MLNFKVVFLKILGYYNRFTCFNAQKNATVFSSSRVQQHCFSSGLFKAPLQNTQSALISQSTHA